MSGLPRVRRFNTWAAAMMFAANVTAERPRRWHVGYDHDLFLWTVTPLPTDAELQTARQWFQTLRSAGLVPAGQEVSAVT